MVVLTAVLGAGIGTAWSEARSSEARARSHAREEAADARVAAAGRERADLAALVRFSPAPGATDVPLDAPVSVSSPRGRLARVRLTTADGHAITGVLDAAARTWTAEGVLAPATGYRLETTVVGATGITATSASTFRTLAPLARVHASLFPTDGMTVGVGQPIVVRFDSPVTSEAARETIVSHLAVAETDRVPGGWRWLSATELHFRPKDFWPAGERIAVTSELEGWNAGDGRWGEGHHSVLFTVGHAHVATADLSTHVMTVTEDGKVVSTYPFSGGREQFPTMNGTHIVLDRESVVRMISSTNGIPVNSPDGYDELVYSDVHISDSGEYVHAAPWSLASQGRTNVSHGCINLSPANALAFLGFSRIGDVVRVVGGPRPPERGDHGVLDWSTPWDQWSPALIHWI